MMRDPTERVIVTGLISGTTWEPLYTVVLSEETGLHRLNLTAKIQSEFPISTDRIILHTRPTLAGPSRRIYHESRVATMIASEPKALPIEIEATYEVPSPGELPLELSVPLIELGQIRAERVYFLQLEENSKAVYGYIFSVSSDLPSSRVKIYDRDLGLIGLGRLEVYGTWVILKAGQVEELVGRAIIEQASPRPKENQTLQFEVEVLSRFTHPVALILELPFSGQLIQTQPLVSEQLPGRLLWTAQVLPGQNRVQGAVVSK